MIDSTSTVSRSDYVRSWYNRLGGIFSDLGDLHIFHGHDDRFGDEIAELGIAVSQLYDEIEQGARTEAQAEQQAADLTGRVAALTARLYTDGRPFTATAADADLVLDATLAAYADATPFTLADLDHVSAITGYNLRWLRRALAERTEAGLLAADTVADTWHVIDPDGLPNRTQTTTPQQVQQSAGVSDEQALDLALALWADGQPFGLVELGGVLTFTGQSWTWLLARLGERVVNGILAYDSASGYRVADPGALKTLTLGLRPARLTLTLTMRVTHHGGRWIAVPEGAPDGVSLAGGLSGRTLAELRHEVEAAKHFLCGVEADVAVTVRYLSPEAAPTEAPDSTTQEVPERSEAGRLAVLVPAYSGHTYTVGPQEAAAVLDHALGFFADGAPFTAAALVDVLDVTGQTRTWLWVRLAEKVADGLLARDVEHATYTVVDAAQVRADAVDAEFTLARQIDEADDVDAVDASDVLADDEPCPARETVSARSAVRSGRIAGFFFALALLTLIFAFQPTTPVSAALTVALAAALAATGFLYRHLARHSN
uniref:hypothetical protein n=1 Tax=Streptosporangium sp. CA-256172 TaxID=3240076 RepID=UPI003F491F94